MLGIGTKASLRMDCSTEKEYTISSKEIGMKANTFLTRQTEREFIIGKMEIGNRESSKTRNATDELSFTTKTEKKNIGGMKMEKC